jgi:ABC-type multidrug transport system fused ATPase/permease subunit
MIHVVERGSIVESGNHEQLLARAGRYAHFCRLRFKGQVEPLTARLTA